MSADRFGASATSGGVARIAPTPDPTADEARVLALLPVVTRWCARLGGPSVDAQEAAHDVVLTVLRRGAPADADGLAHFTFAVTRNVVANHRRRVWWWRWVPGVAAEPAPTASVGAQAEARDIARRVAAVLERLGAQHREVLVLCDVEERSAAEVGRLLGVPEGTVRSRLRLARARFRALAPAHHLHGPEGDEP